MSFALMGCLAVSKVAVAQPNQEVLRALEPERVPVREPPIRTR